ncbi:hypothetical protein [Luteirhabdus pelagi]|uniref:hypothetical protein n=1 Tax=Luteirhabdus pelagi TaxID=2792783 RepID=UPI001939AFBE|nr:hypothetical protein [Luteirhabdus pelagi]
MEVALPYRIDAQRRLCIKKDLIELSGWIDVLAQINEEIDSLKIIEKQLIKDSATNSFLVGIRRKNTLVMGVLCNYEKELNTEYEYGKKEYNVQRAKEHEKKRTVFNELMNEFTTIKKKIYHQLSKYERK